ncbi:MAG: hypothetical protein KC646_07755 [Candidatus Cloacimonetes bacterium]|nr:hypothetical protein [Candidatus Cloacimonadota bacterium]
MLRHTFKQFHNQFSWITSIATFLIFLISGYFIFNCLNDPYISTSAVPLTTRADRFLNSGFVSSTIMATFVLGIVYFSILAAYQFGNPHGFNWLRLTLSPKTLKYRFFTNLVYGVYKVFTFAGIIKTISFILFILPTLVYHHIYSIELEYVGLERLEGASGFLSSYGTFLIVCLALITITLWTITKPYLSKSSRGLIAFELCCLFTSFTILSYPFAKYFSHRDLLPNYHSFFSLILIWVCSYTLSLLFIAYLRHAFLVIIFSITTQLLALMIAIDLSMTIIKPEAIAILIIIFSIITSFHLFSASQSTSKLQTTFTSFKQFIPYVVCLITLVLFIRVKANYMNLFKEAYHYSYDQNENSLHVHQLKRSDQYYLFPALKKPIQTVTTISNLSRHIQPIYNQTDYTFRFEENPSVFKNGLDLKIYQNKKLLDTFYFSKLSTTKNTKTYKDHHDYFRVSKGDEHTLNLMAKDPIHGSIILGSSSGEYYRYKVGSKKLEKLDGVVTLIGADPVTGIQNLKDQPYFILAKNGAYQLHSAKGNHKVADSTLQELRNFGTNENIFFHESYIYSFSLKYFGSELTVRPNETEITLKSLDLSTKQLVIKKVNFNKGQKISDLRFSNGKVFLVKRKQLDDNSNKTLYYKELEAKKSFKSIVKDTICSVDFKGQVVPLLSVEKIRHWQYRSNDNHYHLDGYFINISSVDKPHQMIQSSDLKESIPKLDLLKISADITKTRNENYYSPLHPWTDRLIPGLVLPSGEIIFNASSSRYNSRSTHFYTFSTIKNTLKMYKTPAHWNKYPIFQDRKGKIFTIPKLANRVVNPVYAIQVKLTGSNKEISHEN